MTRKTKLLGGNPLNSGRLFLLTLLAMIAFAGNSLLCRLALKQTTIDPATFTFIRILSGAVVLAVIVTIRKSAWQKTGSWPSALALFVYATAFSFAYVNLSAGTGALLLFGAVQATMIFWGWRRGERLRAPQVIGLALALAGLVALVLPGLSAPPLVGVGLMLSAGIAWGIYSLRGKGTNDAASATASNFIRALPFAAAVGAVCLPSAHLDPAGVTCAVVSGAIASGLGYIVWYAAVRHLAPAIAATVQLSVPMLAATGGILLLGEPLTLRFFFASLAILGGIAFVVLAPFRQRVA